MNAPKEQRTSRVNDSIQQRLTDYACALNYDSLTPQAIHAAKVRVIDTLGGLVGGGSSASRAASPARLRRACPMPTGPP